MNLKNLQKHFIASILNGSKETISEQLDTSNISVDSLIGIYQNNTISTLTNALLLTYPVIEKLVGYKFFKFACKEFMKSSPPTSGNLDDYGHNFGDFLNTFEPAKTVPYLADVAKLEWLIHSSDIANQDKSVEQNILSGISQDKFYNIKFKPRVSIKLFASKHPVCSIWEYCSEENNAANENKMDIADKGAEYVFISRQKKRALPELIMKAEFILLENIMAGRTLFESYEQALEADEEFDLAFYLQKHIVNGTFYEFLLT